MSIPNNRKKLHFFKESIQKVDPKPPDERKFKFPDGILIALIPVLAYGLLYAYESSFLDFYGIPSIYINFDWAELFIFSSVIFTTVWILFSWLGNSLILTRYINNKTSREKLLVIIFILLYLLILSLQFFARNDSVIGIMNLILAIVLFLIIFLPVFRTKGNLRFREKLEEHLLKIWSDDSEITFIDISLNRFGKGITLGIAIYLALFFLMFVTGKTNAFQKIDYLVVRGNPDCVVVYPKTSYLICVQYDKSKQEFITGYMILMNEDLKGVKIENERLGKIHPKTTYTPTLIRTPLPTNTQTETPLPTITQLPTEIPIPTVIVN